MKLLMKLVGVLGEGITVQDSDLDISSVMGMGFPPYK